VGKEEGKDRSFEVAEGGETLFKRPGGGGEGKLALTLFHPASINILGGMIDLRCSLRRPLGVGCGVREGGKGQGNESRGGIFLDADSKIKEKSVRAAQKSQEKESYP